MLYFRRVTQATRQPCLLCVCVGVCVWESGRRPAELSAARPSRLVSHSVDRRTLQRHASYGSRRSSSVPIPLSSASSLAKTTSAQDTSAFSFFSSFFPFFSWDRDSELFLFLQVSGGSGGSQGVGPKYCASLMSPSCHMSCHTPLTPTTACQERHDLLHLCS
jgi:hypothetical protein